MSRRVNLLILLALAASLCYGRYGVPLFLQYVSAEAEETPVDPAVAEKQRAAQEQLDEWIRSQYAAEMGDDRTLVAQFSVPQEFDRSRLRKEAIRGTVNAVSAGQFVMLDIGSSTKIWEGISLEIHRSGPIPFQLGNLEIVQVWPDRAVGRIIAPCPPVRRGEEVRTELFFAPLTE